MKLEELKKGIRNAKQNYRGICHDCSTLVEVRVIVNDDGQIEISGGALYRVTQQFGKKELFYKCDDCYKRDKTLHSFRECEVYSRAVGYLRPVNQWNKGKREEFKHRTLFKNLEGD